MSSPKNRDVARGIYVAAAKGSKSQREDITVSGRVSINGYSTILDNSAKEFRPDEFRSVEQPLKKVLDSEWLIAIYPVCFVNSSESITMSLSTLRMLDVESLCRVERGQLTCWFSTVELLSPGGTPRLDCVEIGEGIRAGLGKFSPLQIVSAI